MNALKQTTPLNSWLSKAKRTLTYTKETLTGNNENHLDQRLRKIQKERENMLKWAKTY